MTNYVVSSGVTLSDITLSAGELMLIRNGGTAISTTISASALEIISSGGVAKDTTVSAAGLEEISSGGVASDTTVSGADSLEFVDAGTATSTTVSAGGTQKIGPGGVASETTVGGGGEDLIFSGGVARSTTVSAGGGEAISTGGVASDTTVRSGGSQTISSGGVARFTTVSGGDEFISSGGVASSMTVVSGGDEVVFSGGVAIDTTVSTGGIEEIANGGVASDTTISSGSEFIFSGGVARGATVGSGGRVTDLGVASDTTVGSGGVMIVQTGGGLFPGSGSAISTTVDSGGTFIVLPGGSATATVSQTGANVLFSGAVVVSNQVLVSATTGTLTSAFLLSGTTGEVWSGGKMVDTEVEGGRLEIVAGGIAISTLVFNNGIDDITSGGLASDSEVGENGNEIVDGATAISTTVGGLGLQLVSAGGVASDTFVYGDGEQWVSDGGTTISTSVTLNGGEFGEHVYQGGVASDTTATSGGLIQIYSGGVSISTTLGADEGREAVYGGGVASDTTVSSGGSSLIAGGVASDTTVSSGGSQIIYDGLSSGGVASDTTVSSGGFEIISAGGVASDTTVSPGGFEIISAGGVASGTLLLGTVSLGPGDVLTVSGGSQLIFDGGVASDTTVSLFGFEIISAGGVASDTLLLPGGAIDVTYLPFVKGGTVSLGPDDVLTVSIGGQVYSQTLNGDYEGEYFHLASGAYGGTEIYVNNTPPCFCRGTLILTDHSEVPVEDLRIGEPLVTRSGAARSIRWIGRRHLDLTRHSAPERAQPILILANAFADGVPARDLRLSPDHAVFIDSVLVPIRLLVNGTSIRRGTECTEVTYYHIELDAHDILLAEGLPAESYLDCGNRGVFENADQPLVLHPDFCRDSQRRREEQSGAPLVTDPASVEPIWCTLADRAAALFGALPEIMTTTEPELAIFMDARHYRPIEARDGRYLFVVPECRSGAILASRAARPCDAKPWIEDRRPLGVMVKKIVVRHGSSVTAIGMDDPRLADGWWAVEKDGASIWRWTNGRAELPLPNGAAAVEVFVGQTGLYPLAASEAARVQHDAVGLAAPQSPNARLQTAAAA